MFSDYSRPFYQSAEIMDLKRLDMLIYTDFIYNHFKSTGKKIQKNSIETCIEWADNHTFYVQYLFNMIWGAGIDKIEIDDIKEIQKEIISSKDSLYSNYRNLLTDKQYRLLRAIAMEKEVLKPNSAAFIKSYDLGSASTVNSALNILNEKELIYQESGTYKLYDVFQSKWFQQNN